MICRLYVDNLQIVGPNLNFINCFKTDLALFFKMTDLGSTSHYLRMKVMRNNNTIIVTQTVYINLLLAVHQMYYCNTATTPMIKELYLAFAPNDFKPLVADVTAYKYFTGSLQWLAY